MVRHLASQFHFRNATEIVGDSNPLTLCARRDERHVCCPSSLGLLDAAARLARFGAAASPGPSELPVERLQPSRLAKWDHFELASSARARLKWRSTDGRDITPSNNPSFGAKALSTTIEVGGESEVAACHLARKFTDLAIATVGLNFFFFKMIGYLSSSISDAEPVEIVGDSNPLTLCTPRDERCVCSPNSVPLLDDLARLVRHGATASPRGAELLVEHLHPLRLAKQDRFELSSSARARLKLRSTDGRDITPSNTLSFGAKALAPPSR